MTRIRPESRSRPTPTLARSVMFVPGDDERKLARAASVPADALIIDLEDAVADARKDLAREMVADAVGRLTTHRVYVRLNSLVTGRTEAEVRAASAAGAVGIVPTKTTGPDEIRDIARMIPDRDAELRIVPLIETAAAVTRAAEMAAASDRVERLAFGIGDLTHDLSLPRGDAPGYDLVLDTVRSLLVLASRTAGVSAPLDGPRLAVRDQAGFEPHCRKARGMGFAGVLCLHPDQVAVANDVFTPSQTQIEQARRIVDAFWSSESEGRASIVVDEIFVDYPIADAASDLLARVDAIEQLRSSRAAGVGATGEDREVS